MGRGSAATAAVAATASHTAARASNLFQRGWARLSRRRPKSKRSKRRSTAQLELGEEATVASTSATVQEDYTATRSPLTATSSNATESAAILAERKNFVNRGMDRIRRSFRKSFHRTKRNGLTSEGSPTRIGGEPSAPTTSISTGPESRGKLSMDEKAVRAGTCQFQVKYLGSCEVFESRGMSVCETALHHLKNQKRADKAILHVSGDSLRVVDQEQNRGLILDQTVEKVSFCAPDRRNDKLFAYICRDGASRRWMCHGFMAVKDSGERLSHAVGCSFAICLEKKKRREAETIAARTQIEDGNGMSRSNQAYSSFRRQLTLSERRQDPQKAIVVDPVPLVGQPVGVPVAPLIDMSSPEKEPPATNGGFDISNASSAVATPTPRPAAGAVPSLFDRPNGSFRAPPISAPAQSVPFRRFNSLRSDTNGVSNFTPLKSLHNEPIYEGEESWPGEATIPQFDNQSFTNTARRSAPVANGGDQVSPRESGKENNVFSQWQPSGLNSAPPNVQPNGVPKSPFIHQTPQWPPEPPKSALMSPISPITPASSMGLPTTAAPPPPAETLNSPLGTPGGSVASSQNPQDPSAPLSIVSAEEWLQKALRSTVTFTSPADPSLTATATVGATEANVVSTAQTNQSSDWLRSLAMNGVLNGSPSVEPNGWLETGIQKFSGLHQSVSQTALRTNNSTSSLTPSFHSASNSFISSPSRTATFDSTSTVTTSQPNLPVSAAVPIDPALQQHRDARKSVQYQILEETDVPPQSPPRLASPLARAQQLLHQQQLQIQELQRQKAEAEERLKSLSQSVAATTPSSVAVPPPVMNTAVPNAVDLFGQPVFNPAPSPVPSFSSQSSAPNTADYMPPASFSAPAAPPTIPSLPPLSDDADEVEKDPFDVEWSTQVLQSARQNAASVAQHPFGTESTPVNV